MSHSNNKPHKCEVCNWGFFQLSNLKRHMASHNLPNGGDNLPNLVKNGTVQENVVTKPSVVPKNVSVAIPRNVTSPKNHVTVAKSIQIASPKVATSPQTAKKQSPSLIRSPNTPAR